jgi:hypothetical protein
VASLALFKTNFEQNELWEIGRGRGMTSIYIAVQGNNSHIFPIKFSAFMKRGIAYYTAGF